MEYLLKENPTSTSEALLDHVTDSRSCCSCRPLGGQTRLTTPGVAPTGHVGCLDASHWLGASSRAKRLSVT